MTSIYFDPAVFEPPAEQEPREQLIVNGRYYLPPLDDPTGKRRSLQRVTNFIKQLSDQGGLTTWKLRSTVIGLARDERRYDLACSINPDSPRGKQELDKLIEECIDLAQAGPSGGNVTGTALHNYTDDVAGSYPIRVRDKWIPKLENYQRALHEKGLRVVPGLQERLVVSERYGTCGRLDDVYEDAFGALRVGDRKSQKEFATWWEIGAQLALYQGSDAMWNEDECRWEDMPALADDVAHVAWMPLSHPAAKKGGSVDTVTIYDLPLAGPREVLEWCLQVRTLRTQARQWGQERPDLDAFATLARDIRDAETHEDLSTLHASIVSAPEFHMLSEMAGKRWEELATQPKPEPVVAPSPNEQARGVSAPPSYDEAVPPAAVEEAAVAYARANDVSCTEGLIAVRGAPMPQEEIERRRAETFDRLKQAGERAKAINAEQGVVMPLFVYGTAPTSCANFFDPGLFVAPEGEEATFLDDEPRGGGDAVPGPQRPAEALGELIGTQPNTMPGTAREYDELRDVGNAELFDLAVALDRPSERGKVAAEILRRVNLGHRLTAEQVNEIDRTWAARGLGLLIQAIDALPESLKANLTHPMTPAVLQAHPIATTQFTHSKHHGSTVVELPGDDEDRLRAIERAQSSPIVPLDLDSVPLKIVKEIATRAGNSSTARGRVRLLNDIESNKPGYVKHSAVLIPAVLAEWLAVDGGPIHDTGCVRNSGGSKRPPMYARDAGPTTLTAYLATKEAPKSEAAEEAETPADAVPDRAPVTAMAIGLTEAAQAFVNDLSERHATVSEMKAAEDERQADDSAPLPDGTLAGDRERILPGTRFQVRQKYLNVLDGPSAGQHSILRLVELAKDARDDVERAQVFEAITRWHRWTGELAAEINQHYLDNGLPLADLDPYFERQAIGEQGALPLDPDDPATVADALQLLEGIGSRDALGVFWQGLTTKPYFQDQALQEALLAKMMGLPK